MKTLLRLMNSTGHSRDLKCCVFKMTDYVFILICKRFCCKHMIIALCYISMKCNFHRILVTLNYIYMVSRKMYLDINLCTNSVLFWLKLFQ